MRPVFIRGLTAAAAATLVSGLGIAVATSASAAAGCRVDYTVNQWNTGFTGQVRIACSGAALSSWKVGWTYGAGQRLTQAWNASCAQSGSAVTCSNASYNATVPDGGSVTFGFNGSWSGSNPVPVVALG